MFNTNIHNWCALCEICETQPEIYFLILTKSLNLIYIWGILTKYFKIIIKLFTIIKTKLITNVKKIIVFLIKHYQNELICFENQEPKLKWAWIF